MMGPYIKVKKEKQLQSVADAEAITNFHPLLFQTEMVQACLKKIKTITRRLRNLKFINQWPDHYQFIGFRWNYDSKKRKQVWCAQFKEPNGFIDNIPFPYGKVGDILWVRENFAYTQFQFDKGLFGKCEVGIPDSVIYQADTENNDWDGGWKPSIHMPKEACRLFYKITSVKVERLNDISNEDAIAEGIARWKNFDEWIKYIETQPLTEHQQKAVEELKDVEKFDIPIYKRYIKSPLLPEIPNLVTDDPKESLISLFHSINKQKPIVDSCQLSSDNSQLLPNPWVWAIGLKPVCKPVNF